MTLVNITPEQILAALITLAAALVIAVVLAPAWTHVRWERRQRRRRLR